MGGDGMRTALSPDANILGWRQSHGIDCAEALAGATEGPQKSVTILGSTGSIGCSTLDLIANARTRCGEDRFPIEALTANRRVSELIEQARTFRPRLAVIADETLFGDLKDGLAGTGIEAAAGQAAVEEAAARPASWVMAAIVGAAGLAPTLKAIQRGAEVALANKECLVCAGDLVCAEVARSGAALLPVDSEHNAIYQAFDPRHAAMVDRIILTASGGPFRTWTGEAMAAATPAQAVAHPNWDMGAKISVDSASMMNKGLELIEAAYLFPIPEDRIDILVHPQSVIHSMVSYTDGSVLAQLGSPDMRTPIAHTLAWPARMPSPAKALDLAAIGQLTFEAPDPVRFPALRLARDSLRAGQGAPTVLNAANEVAVERFLRGDLGFLTILSVVERTLSRLVSRFDASGGTAGVGDNRAGPILALEDVLALDQEARRVAVEEAEALRP